MWNIVLLGITSLLTDISSEMIYPVLPLYLVGVLGATPALLGIIEGVAESLASLLKVFSGYFSDRSKSRKPFAIFGYGASGVGKLIFCISAGWGYFLFGRVIDRFGKGIRTAPRDALIAESADVKKKGAAFGLHRSMDTVGAVCGVAIAYFVIKYFHGELKDIFFLSLVPAFLGVGVLFFVKERRAGQPAAQRKKIEFKWRSLDKRLKLFLIFSFIFTLGNSSNQFLLLRAKDLGGGIPQVLLFYLFYNVIYALVSYPAAFISDRIGRKKILVAGYLFYGLVYLGFALNGSMQVLWFLFGMYGLYMGFTEGVEKALVSELAPGEMRATVIGLHATIVGIALLPASLLAGLLWNFFGAWAAFYFGGAMGIIASVGIWFILKGL
jgi:MFS family permease